MSMYPWGLNFGSGSGRGTGGNLPLLYSPLRGTYTGGGQYGACGGSDSSLFVPSELINATTDQNVTPPKAAAPIRDTASFSRERVRYIAGSSCVSGLLNLCSPSTIFSAVRAVIVDSINRQMRSMTISCGPIVKIFERVKKDIYTTAPVMPIIFIVWIATPIFHSIPNPVNSCVAKTMFCDGFKYRLFMETSTTTSMPASETDTRNDNTFSAVTETKPHCSTVMSPVSFYNSKTIKLFAGDVNGY